jgi:Ohr subfamily peroxiredoxin
MTTGGKLLYTAKTRTTGGREHGIARSSDGRLDIRFATPGSTGIGANPEQLFAAAWSACFESAIAHVARQQNVTLPASSAVDAEVDLKLENSGYSISARLNISLPDLDRTVAQALVAEAHQICAYSKATRGNVLVTITLI